MRIVEGIARMKKPYARPELVEYGPVTRLTLGTNQYCADNANANSNPTNNQNNGGHCTSTVGS